MYRLHQITSNSFFSSFEKHFAFAKRALGTLQARGGLRCVLPSVELTHNMETWSVLRAATNHPRFRSCPDDACSSGQGSFRDFVRDLWEAGSLILRVARDIMKCLAEFLPTPGTRAQRSDSGSGAESRAGAASGASPRNMARDATRAPFVL